MQSYKSETIGAIMSATIPTCSPTSTVKALLELLSSQVWDDIHYAYVIDESGALVGTIVLPEVMRAAPEANAESIMKPVVAKLTPDDAKDKVLFLALKHDIDAIPVVNDKDQLVGAVTAKHIINIMHNKHIEGAMLASGIRRRGGSMAKLATANLLSVFGSRAPWLIVGGFIGIALGFIASQFEVALEKSIAIAYFIPVVAYIADSVGTQSEAITVRALATLKLNYPVYLLREVLIGGLLGITLGLIGALGAFVISQSPAVGLAVGLSLVAASTIAATLAALIPILFRWLGKDPALGSGPLSTALQDIISVIVYFLCATWLIH